MNDQDTTRPFAFEDLPLNAYGKRVEPEKWGPIYSKPQKTRRMNDETNIPTNCASGQKGDFSAAKHRASIRAKFAAAAASERLAWATGKIKNYQNLTIEQAYAKAMAEKRARLASTMREAA